MSEPFTMLTRDQVESPVFLDHLRTMQHAWAASLYDARSGGFRRNDTIGPNVMRTTDLVWLRYALVFLAVAIGVAGVLVLRRRALPLLIPAVVCGGGLLAWIGGRSTASCWIGAAMIVAGTAIKGLGVALNMVMMPFSLLVTTVKLAAAGLMALLSPVGLVIAAIGGLGVYGSTSAHGPFIHVDVRGTRARW